VIPDADREHANFERFARGEPIAVEVGEIERELGALWKSASKAGDGPAGTAVSRAALWNLLIPTRGAEALAKTKALVDAIAQGVPVRAITLCLDDPQVGVGLTATIESNVVSQPGGARVVYSEEITLRGPVGAETHFGALVRALQIPGVPTAALWMDAAMPAALLTRELLPVTDRLIVDTGSCVRPPHLFDLQRLAAHAHPLPVADLGWLRLGSLRLLFAGLFDPPVGGAPLQRATRLSVRHRPGGDLSALLLVAWLGQMLGWLPLRSAQTSDGGLRFDFARGADGPAARLATMASHVEADIEADIEAYLVPTEGACDASGVLAIELSAKGRDEYAVCRTAIDQASVQLPIAPAKAVKLDAYSDAELCVAALGPRGRDPLFARCLAYAGGLWALEPQTTGSRR
jgi:glucose-6-phosphate dehydrogenase assembly protein OpcA